jgi:hypothetical protein
MRPENLFNRFSFRKPPARPVKPENWVAVVRALCDRRTLRMRYRTAAMMPGDPPKESLIDPYHVANLQGEWYLFGVHTGQTEVRQFSMAASSAPRSRPGHSNCRPALTPTRCWPTPSAALHAQSVRTRSGCSSLARRRDG